MGNDRVKKNHLTLSIPINSVKPFVQLAIAQLVVDHIDIKNKKTRNENIMEKNEIIIYKSQDGTIKVDVLFEGKTVWLTMD